MMSKLSSYDIQSSASAAVLTTVISALAVLTALSSCGPSDTVSCSVDSDCFRGETCEQGICVADPDNSGATNGGTNNGVANNGGGNNGVANNSGTNNSSSNNVIVSPPNNGELGVCEVDLFSATCTSPDDNDDFSDYIEIDSDCGEEDCGPPGCNGSWDDFIGGSTRIEAMQLCALEEKDLYSTNLVPCDNKTFVVEATMKPREDCDPDLYVFNMAVQGFDCTNPEDRVRCEVLPDGSKKITAFVRPSISIASASFSVEKRGVENVQFDYDIDIVVRE